MWKLSDFAVDRPKLTLLLIFLLTLALMPGMKNLRIDSDFEKQLPKDHHIMAHNENYKEIFGDKKTIYLAIVNKENTIYNHQTLSVIAALSQEIKAIPDLIEANTFSVADSKDIKGDGDVLDVSYLIEEDYIPQSKEEIDKFRQAAEANPLFYGKTISKDGTTAIISLDVRGDWEKPKTGPMLYNLVEKYQTDEIEIHVTGAIVLWDIDQGVSNDFGILVPFALVLVMIGLFFSFRTARGVFIPVALITFANLGTLGIMGYLHFEFGPITSIVPILIVVLGGSYAIHSLHRFYEAAAEKGSQDIKAAIKEGMRAMGGVVAMAGFTSACGTLSLLTFKVGSIQQFGVSGCIGTLFCALYTLTLNPAILSLLKAPSEKTLQKFAPGNQGPLWNFLVKVGNFSINHKPAVLALVVVLCALSLFGATKVKTGQDTIAWFPPDHKVRLAADLLIDKIGGTNAIWAMIDGGEEDAMKDPEVLNYVWDFQKYALSLPDIGMTSSFSDVIALLNQEMHEGQEEFYVIPDSRNLVSQYLLLYSMSGDLDDFESLVIDYRYTSIVLTMNDFETNKVRRTYNDLVAYAEEHFPPHIKLDLGGPNLVFVVMDEYVVNGKIVNIIVTLLMVLTFCTVVFRSFIGGLMGMIPIALATLINFGLMGLFGIRLDIASGIVTGIGVGIGVDFILHFLFRLKEEAGRSGDITKAISPTMGSEGSAIIFDTGSNVFAFVVFLTSFLIPIQNFGWLVGFIMISACFTTLVVTPALVDFLNPKFLLVKRETQN